MRLPFVQVYYLYWEEWLEEDLGATSLPDDWLLSPLNATLGGKR